jgi:hypothetical protein
MVKVKFTLTLVSHEKWLKRAGEMMQMIWRIYNTLFSAFSGNRKLQEPIYQFFFYKPYIFFYAIMSSIRRRE